MPRAIIIQRIIKKYMLSLVLILSSSTADACGLGWVEPRDYFNGIDKNGFVRKTVHLGDIPLSNDISLPFFAIFNSNPAFNFSLAGAGWQITLLESNIVQIDENQFYLIQPDGREQLFYRNKKNPLLLDGESGWTVKISGNSMFASDNCCTVIKYSRGRISEIKYKEFELNYIYDSHGLVEIKGANQSILKIERKNDEFLFRFHDKSIAKLGLTERPQISNFGENLIIEQMSKSLGFFKNSFVNFEVAYGVDSKMHPFISIGNETAVWNPSSKYAVKVNSSDFLIDVNDVRNSIKISKTDEMGAVNTWTRDSSSSCVLIERSNGSKIENAWFNSSILRGRFRYAKHLTNKANSEIRFIYKENGEVSEIVIQNSENQSYNIKLN